MGKYRKLSHVVYQCNYHIVWVPKYRFQLLTVGAMWHTKKSDRKPKSSTDETMISSRVNPPQKPPPLVVVVYACRAGTLSRRVKVPLPTRWR